MTGRPVDVPGSTAVVRDALGSMGEVDLGWLEPAVSGWSLAPDALRFVVRLLELLAPAHVLEFGSGVSTHALARGCAALGPPAVLSAVENDPAVAAETEASLQRVAYGSVVTVVFAPLVVSRGPGRHAPVYSFQPDALAAADPPGLVLVDGPPAALGGRLGSMRQAMELVAPGGVVVLDDARRPEEREVLARLRGGGATVVELPGFERGIGVVLRPASNGGP